ncbi:MAG: hypothetical protein KO253_04575 [Methanobrevibacter arboriphilus]|nr:hypothetical protein [Methanobrevibacter arboriphilus]
MDLFNKIDLWYVIKEHFNTLYDHSLKENKENDVKKKSKGDLFVFIGIPIIFGLILTFLTINSRIDFSGIFLTSLSIFTPIMFSVLSIIYSLSQKNLTKKGFRVLKEFKFNVLFVIILSLVTILLLIINSIDISLFQNPFFMVNLIIDYNNLNLHINLYFSIIIFILNFLIYGSIINIGLTMLMVLQRFDYVMNKVIRNNERKLD